VIHIVRNDNIEWLKSLFLAKETKTYTGQKYPDGVKIKINVKNAISRIKSKNWLDYCINLLEKTNPYCQVTYEHFQHEKKKATQKLFQFLNCDNEINISEFYSIKQSKGHPKDYIRNYYELFEALEKKQILFSNCMI
jgi:hypothetical protein